MSAIDDNNELLNTLTESLQSSDPAVRFNAGLDLANLGDHRSMPALIETFEHGSKAMRLFYASKALIALGEVAIPALKAALASSNNQVCIDAAYTLFHIDNGLLDDLLPIAIAGLADNDPAVIEDALQFLSEIDNPAVKEAVLPLRTFLHSQFTPVEPDDWYADLRVYAAILLAKIGEPLDDIVKELAEALSHPATAVRWGAACALAELGATTSDTAASTAIADLATVIHNESEVESVRVEAAYALATIGNPASDTIPVLLDLLQSRDWWMRVYAARIIGEMVSTSSKSAVSENFSQFLQVLMAAGNVQHLDDPSHVVAALTNALSDSDYNVRRNAIWALSEIGQAATAAIPALVEALKAADTGPIAAEALAKIGDGAVDTISELLDNEDDLCRRYAAYALRRIDSDEARNTLEAAEHSQPIAPLEFSPRHFYVSVPVQMTQQKQDAFEKLYQETLARGMGSEVDYALPYPKHEFLRYLVEYKDLMLHGSDKPDIALLKPLRLGVDAADHGNVSGVYADPDPIRPIYFAVVNGPRCHGNTNSFIDIDGSELQFGKGRESLEQRVYKLAVGAHGLRRDFWQKGMMYILRPDTFEYWHEWTSRAPVQPLMRLAVEPDDLPLKDEVWGMSWRHPNHWWITKADRFPYLKEVQGTPIHPTGRPPWLDP